jgi:four helix bundle protein
MAIKSFRDLRVWQMGMDLVEQVYRLTRSFPRHEIYGLAAQLQRAAVSIPSNIAEGHARWHLREYLHHLSIAQASIAELDTQIEIARRLDYLAAEDTEHLLTHTASLGRQLHTLRKALTKAKEPA